MFLTIRDPFGPIWTISNKNWFLPPSTSAKPHFVHLGQKIIFVLKYSQSSWLMIVWADKRFGSFDKKKMGKKNKKACSNSWNAQIILLLYVQNMTNETSSPTLFLSKLGVEEGQRTVAFTESCRPGLRRPLELTAAHRNPMPSAAAPKSFLRNHLRTLVCSWICQEKKWWISLFQGICIFELVRCSFWVDDVKVGGWVLYLVAAGR